MGSTAENGPSVGEASCIAERCTASAASRSRSAHGHNALSHTATAGDRTGTAPPRRGDGTRGDVGESTPIPGAPPSRTAPLTRPVSPISKGTHVPFPTPPSSAAPAGPTLVHRDATRPAGVGQAARTSTAVVPYPRQRQRLSLPPRLSKRGAEESDDRPDRGAQERRRHWVRR